MLPQRQSATDSVPPRVNEAAVRAQLQRLLAHPLFTASKRYPTLLAYTVEETLRGNAGELKERTIGVGAFGREPDYDANADPVVRIVAAEVRKRLIQYYYDPTHAAELVIELSPGSYVPSFREPEPAVSLAPPNEPGPRASDPRAPVTGALPAVAHPRHRAWVRHAAVALLAGTVGLVAGQYRPTPAPTNLELFWKPFVSSSNSVTYCVGEPGLQNSPPPVVSQDAPVRVVGRFDVSDVVTLARTIVPLAPSRRPFRVLPASETTFPQLREGPVVLIGAFNNAWTLRLTETLRFGFESGNGGARIVDRKGTKRTVAELRTGLTYGSLDADYAIVARLHDKLTGQPVVIVGGILDKGTAAASEVLYNPVYLDALLAKAPRNWADLNLQAVIRTQVVGGNPGPPSVLAVETW